MRELSSLSVDPKGAQGRFGWDEEENPSLALGLSPALGEVWAGLKWSHGIPPRSSHSLDLTRGYPGGTVELS